MKIFNIYQFILKCPHRRLSRFYIIIQLIVSFTSCSNAKSNSSPLPIAPRIEMDKLEGEWNVISRIPTYFDQDAVDIKVSLKNSAKSKLDGTWTFKENINSGSKKEYSISIQAGENTQTTRWTISSFWFIKTNVQVIEFSGDLNWIIVGSSDHRYLWVLSRGAVVDSNLLHSLLDRIKSMNFDISAIRPKIS